MTGKQAGWRALQQLEDARLADIDLELLVQRATEQRERIEEQRVEAARLALLPNE